MRRVFSILMLGLALGLVWGCGDKKDKQVVETEEYVFKVGSCPTCRFSLVDGCMIHQEWIDGCQDWRPSRSAQLNAEPQGSDQQSTDDDSTAAP